MVKTFLTDLGLVEVEDPTPELPKLKQVAQVSGVGVGSTMIDVGFRKLVQRRLDTAPGILPEGLALALSRSVDFYVAKHSFGTALAFPEYGLPLYTLNLGISETFTHEGMKIDRGRMHFSR
jgi:hypothetical protein